MNIPIDEMELNSHDAESLRATLKGEGKVNNSKSEGFVIPDESDIERTSDIDKLEKRLNACMLENKALKQTIAVFNKFYAEVKQNRDELLELCKTIYEERTPWNPNNPLTKAIRKAENLKEKEK